MAKNPQNHHIHKVPHNECKSLRIRYMLHLHYLNTLLSTSHFAPQSRRFDGIIGIPPGLSTFTYPKVSDCFLSECNVLSTPSLLKDLLPDLDQLFSYYQLNAAGAHTFAGPDL
jgi:hypothetical protein